MNKQKYHQRRLNTATIIASHHDGSFIPRAKNATRKGVWHGQSNYHMNCGPNRAFHDLEEDLVHLGASSKLLDVEVEAMHHSDELLGTRFGRSQSNGEAYGYTCAHTPLGTTARNVTLPSRTQTTTPVGNPKCLQNDRSCAPHTKKQPLATTNAAGVTFPKDN